jgi:ectoine hydroxylase-related dioxygenase (phytanoyl-CoA dioxygenase family)
VNAISAEANRIYAERDALQAAGRLPEQLYDQHVRKRLMLLKDVKLNGDNALAVLTTTILKDTATHLLARAPEPSRNSFVRTIFADKDGWQLPFHQDQMLLQRPLLNVWIALTPCGTEAPGLELVVTDKSNLLATFADDRKEFSAAQKQIAESEVIKTFGPESLWHPIMAPGDALIFRGTTIHRTFVTSAMDKPRISIELRFV